MPVESEITDIEPREKGTVIHTVFERLILEWLEAHPDAKAVLLDVGNSDPAEFLDQQRAELRGVQGHLPGAHPVAHA